MKLTMNYGWNKHFEKYINEHKNSNLETGRVVSVKGFIYTLITDKGETESALSGKLLFGAEPEYLPKVGDWVLFIRYETQGYIVEVLPRMNELSRRNPGTKTEKQVLAANIDYAIIVQGLDDNFNIMRLERYLVQVTACNINPVIVLNKSDLISDPEEYKSEVAKLGRECPVFCCSTYNQTGIAELMKAVLKKNKTYILVGSSGVGKSSLLNSFMNNSLRLVGEVSVSTGKGRHVTTTRDLFVLPNGSLIIDTPGMKEFGIVFDEGSQTGGLFPLIDELAENCRFHNCRHIEETGCAVLAAFQSGMLESTVYESYLKLMKEQRHFEIKIEDKKRMGKQFGKMVREVREYRKKYKY